MEKMIENINVGYFWKFLEKLSAVLSAIWNYPLFSADGQSVKIANLLVALIFLIIGFKLARFLSKLVKHKLLKILDLDKSATQALTRISHYFFTIIIALIVLDIAKVPITVFTFIGGALAVSVGVGCQHLINNFVSGLIIMIERPVNVGDVIEIDGVRGRVVNIGSRSVHIQNSQNKYVLIPHSIILQNKLINWTLFDNKIREKTNFMLDFYDFKIGDFEEALLKEVSNCPDILKNPKPKIYLNRFQDNSVEYEVHFWVNLHPDLDRNEILGSVNQVICRFLKFHEIKLAFSERIISSQK